MNLHGKQIKPEIRFLAFPKPMYLSCAVERGKASNSNGNREQSAKYFCFHIKKKHCSPNQGQEMWLSELKPFWTYPCCFFAKDRPSPFLAHVQLKPDRTRLDEFVKDADPRKLEAISQSNGLTEMCLFSFTGTSDRAETQQGSPW